MTIPEAFARPLWRLADGEPRARRVRVLLALPVLIPLALVAAPYGVAQWHVGFVIAALLILLCFILLLYVSALSESALIAAFHAHDREVVARSIALACDAVVGSVIGRLLAAALGTNIYAAISLSATLLPIYNFIGRQFLLGELAESIARMLLPQGGIRMPAQYSHADALAMRGMVDDALAELQQAAARAPRDPAALLHGARILRDARRHADAAVWLRLARCRMKAPSRQDALAGRELAELLLFFLPQPERGLTELARLAHTYRGQPVGEWAATALRENKERILTSV